MKDYTIKSDISVDGNRIIEYKGMILPYFDLQMLAMTCFVALATYLILTFNFKDQNRKNLLNTAFITSIFFILIWWYSMPRSIFYNLLRIG